MTNMKWEDFENELVNKHIYTIDNNSSMNIVLFGSCHMATIGFMLNKLLNYSFNIHIIISWFFENKGLENFDMVHINNVINNLVSSCDFFIYHKHINDYHVNATLLPSLIKENCLKFMVPNYRLDYTSNKDIYEKSLFMLGYNISCSDFPEFKFVIDNLSNIMFFNTTNHPTHYLLFLQSQIIQNKILNNGESININNYFSEANRNYFKDFNYITLPGKENIDDNISNITGININADFFD